MRCILHMKVNLFRFTYDIITIEKGVVMDMNRFKRDYKFKSTESDNDGKRNLIIIIVGIVIVIALAYFLR